MFYLRRVSAVGKKSLGPTTYPELSSVLLEKKKKRERNITLIIKRYLNTKPDLGDTVTFAVLGLQL